MQNDLQTYITRVKARIYFQRSLEGITTGLIGSLMAWMCVLVLYKTEWLSLDGLWTWSRATLVFPLAGLTWAFAHRIDSNYVAMKIDEVNDLNARLTTAWCFLQEPEEERTDFMNASIDDAREHIHKIRLSEAAPFAAPRDLLPLGLVILAVVGLVLVKPPTIHGTLLPEEPLPPAESVIGDTELKIIKDKWEDTKEELQESEDPEAQAIVHEMDDLFGKLENREINKEEFIHQVDKLNKEHFDDKEEEWRTLVDEIKDVEAELADNKHTKDIAEALKEGDLDKAAKALENLAKKLENGEIKDRDVEKLAKKLEDLAKKFDKENKALQAALEKKKKELERLKKQLADKAEKLSKEQKKRLSRLERELAKLTKKKKSFDQSGRGKTLKKLSRSTKQAADELRKTKKRGKGATRNKEQRAQARKGFGKATKSAANELRDVNKQAKTGRAKDSAQRQLNNLKETARRNNQNNNPSRDQRLQNFDQRAQGLDPQNAQNGQPQNGQPQNGQPQQGGKQGPQKGGKQGKSQGGKTQQSAQGASGKPGGSSAESQGKSGKQGQNQKGGKANKDEGGPGQGSGKGNEVLGKETHLANKGFKNAKVDSKRGSDGPSQSEIIEAAATGGFGGPGYKEAYDEYEAVAEEVLETEKVPPGYRYYVRKYFDLIRPRDAQ